MATESELHRRTVQALRTDRLLGVDFMPSAVARGMLDAIAAAKEPAVAAGGDAPPRDSSERVSGRASSDRVASATRRDPATNASVPSTDSAKMPPPVRNSVDDGEKGARLEALRARHEAECPHCTVATAHTQIVFGEGDPSAALMFVGEAPGETEDRLGRPFVGRAGQKLDEIIAAMGLARESVYIANVLKSRPPENRTPLRHEVEACGPYLHEQIRIIRPKVIVTLGGPAAKLLLGVETGITRLRGVWAEFVDGDETVPVMPTFHPAYLLRNYTPQTRKQVWSDMLQVCERLGLAAR